MELYKRGSGTEILSEEDLPDGLFEALEKLGSRKKVLAIPPDHTRFHSHAGVLTQLTWEYYRGRLTDGTNTTADGERFFYISNPALGLWAYGDRLD